MDGIEERNDGKTKKERFSLHFFSFYPVKIQEGRPVSVIFLCRMGLAANRMAEGMALTHLHIGNSDWKEENRSRRLQWRWFFLIIKSPTEEHRSECWKSAMVFCLSNLYNIKAHSSHNWLVSSVDR